MFSSLGPQSSSFPLNFNPMGSSCWSDSTSAPIDHLLLSISRNSIPLDATTRVDYGFIRCRSRSEEMCLLAVYRGLLSTPGTHREDVHRACENGTLGRLMKDKLESTPQEARGVFWSWFQTRADIVELGDRIKRFGARFYTGGFRPCLFMPRKWTTEEEDLLIDLVDEELSQSTRIRWKAQIAPHFPQRTPNAVNRHYKILMSGVKNERSTSPPPASSSRSGSEQSTPSPLRRRDSSTPAQLVNARNPFYADSRASSVPPEPSTSQRWAQVPSPELEVGNSGARSAEKRAQAEPTENEGEAASGAEDGELDGDDAVFEEDRPENGYEQLVQTTDTIIAGADAAFISTLASDYNALLQNAQLKNPSTITKQELLNGLRFSGQLEELLEQREQEYLDGKTTHVSPAIDRLAEWIRTKNPITGEQVEAAEGMDME